jgi:hypothetical protein
MLQGLAAKVRLCYQRAAEAKQRAEEASDPEAKAELLTTEKRWLLLARNCQFSDSLKDFTGALDRQFSTVNTPKKFAERHRSRQALNREENLPTIIDSTRSCLLGAVVALSSEVPKPRLVGAMTGGPPLSFQVNI